MQNNQEALIAPAQIRASKASTCTVSTIENMVTRMAASANPWFSAVSQSNIALLGLATRQSQDLLALPAQLATCKSPQDLVRMQAQFCFTALHQQAEAMRRMSHAWGSVLPMASQFARVSAGAADHANVPTAVVPPARDRLNPADANSIVLTAAVTVTPGAVSDKLELATPQHGGDQRTAA
jgi:hypothetical protein